MIVGVLCAYIRLFMRVEFCHFDATGGTSRERVEVAFHTTCDAMWLIRQNEGWGPMPIIHPSFHQVLIRGHSGNGGWKPFPLSPSGTNSPSHFRHSSQNIFHLWLVNRHGCSGLLQESLLIVEDFLLSIPKIQELWNLTGVDQPPWGSAVQEWLDADGIAVGFPNLAPMVASQVLWAKLRWEHPLPKPQSVT